MVLWVLCADRVGGPWVWILVAIGAIRLTAYGLTIREPDSGGVAVQPLVTESISLSTFAVPLVTPTMTTPANSPVAAHMERPNTRERIPVI